MKPRLVVMASGWGTNLQALLDACASGAVPAVVAGVVSDRPGAHALERARVAGVPSMARSFAELGRDRDAFGEWLRDAVLSFEPDLVVMAGFMHVLSPRFFEPFGADQLVNVHPSLLPDDPRADVVTLPDGSLSPVFRGHNALEQALAAGVRWTGTTVHHVTVDVDRGPVLAREPVPIHPDDTLDALRARVQEVEHRLLPATVASLATRPTRSVG